MTDPSELRKYLTEDELRRFFATIKSVRDRAIFTLTYWRGLRASEVGLMPWSAWDQKGKRIFVHRLKKSCSGEYALAPAETKALIAWRTVRGNEPGPMFSSRESTSFTLEPHGKTSAGIGRGMIYVLTEQYARAAALPDHLRHPHMLKHSLGTHLLAKGVGIVDVQEWLGHASITSTLVYSRIRNAQRDAVAAKVYLQG